MFPIEYAFAVVSGVLVGFSLGLIGGGGSILAIPLFIYFVGIDNVHAAIGTTALAVSLNSFFNFTQHLRLGNADLRIGSIFAGIGVAGVLAGTTLGLITPGSSLLFYFSIVMVGIGIYMLFERRRERQGAGGNRYGRISLSSLVAGFASGYFGIGGGFLIVPSLLYSSSIGMNRTVGTSLLAVGDFRPCNSNKVRNSRLPLPSDRYPICGRRHNRGSCWSQAFEEDGLQEPQEGLRGCDNRSWHIPCSKQLPPP